MTTGDFEEPSAAAPVPIAATGGGVLLLPPLELRPGPVSIACASVGVSEVVVICYHRILPHPPPESN